jgi:drug/metabolite transporter (DMT)-like permease
MKNTVIVFVAFYAATSATALVLLRSSMPNMLSGIRGNGYTSRYVAIFAVGMALYLITLLMWLYLVANNDLGVLYPMAVAFVTIFSVLGAAVFLKEQLNWLHVLGACAIIFGVFLVYRASLRS